MPRSPKGTVSVVSQDGMLRLSWSHHSKRYRLTLGLSDTRFHRQIAAGRAAEIEADLALGRFDDTLARYRPQANETLTTLELFERWVSILRAQNTPESTLESRHLLLLGNLRRHGRELTTQDDAIAFIQFLSGRQRPATVNVNLGILRQFGKWSVGKGGRTYNPFEEIKPLKGAERAAKGDPFSGAEVSLILATMAAGQYAHYHDFTAFLFATGCRTGEAIALQWRHLDLDRGTVTLKETLTRAKNGKRIRKPPKTGAKGVRTLALPPWLVQLLRDRRPFAPRADDLVFPGPKGAALHDRNFRNRVWKTTLEVAGLPYRKPYFTRHTLASLMLEAGATMPQVATALGHVNTRMVQTTYGRTITAPTLPDFGHELVTLKEGDRPSTDQKRGEAG